MGRGLLGRGGRRDFLNHVVTAPMVVAGRSRLRVETSSYDDFRMSPMEGAMRKLLIVSGLVALIAGPAMAADIGFGGPPLASAPINDWSGFYVGGHAGYGWGHDPFTSSVGGLQGGIPGFQSFNVPPVTLGGIDPKGFVGGAHFGYNQQWGSWVGGLEVDISGTAMKGSTANTSTGSISTSQILFDGFTQITTTVTQPSRTPRASRTASTCSARRARASGAWFRQICCSMALVGLPGPVS